MITEATTRRLMSQAARAYALSRRWDDAFVPLFDAYRQAARPRTHDVRPPLSPQPAGGSRPGHPVPSGRVA